MAQCQAPLSPAFDTGASLERGTFALSLSPCALVPNPCDAADVRHMTLCRLCQRQPASVKAHVIPKSFFVEHLEQNDIPRIVATSKDFHPKKSPIGVYDPEILCIECEARFSPYDDYGFEFFHPTGNLEVIFPGTAGEANIVRGVDYKLLKLFILSVLWRASVSGQIFYAGVKLGPYENEIRTLILADDAGSPQDFSVMIHRFTYPSELIPILCPVSSRIEGLNFYQLLLNGFLVLVKVDRQPLPHPLPDIALAPNRPLVILPKDYKDSIEHRIMVRAAQNAPRT